MADNYLEKKMEEHRRAGAVRPAARRSTSGALKPGFAAVKLDVQNVLVTAPLTDAARATISRLRTAGCRVAFIGNDDKEGTLFAQSSGSRFYPARYYDSVISDLLSSWGTIDGLIITDPDNLPVGWDKVGWRRVIKVYDGAPILDASQLTLGEIADIALLICLSSADRLVNLCSK